MEDSPKNQPEIEDENFLEASHIKASELQNILDGITEPLIQIDPDFTISRVNRAVISFAEKKRFKDVIKKTCYQILYQRDQVCPYCPMQKHDPKKDNFNDSFHPESMIREIDREIILKSNHKDRILYLSFFPLIENNKVYSIVEKIGDITQIREGEEETLRIRNLASLGVLISGVAHELNNPLTGISMTVQNIIGYLDGMSGKEKEYLGKKLELIQQDISRASLIVNDIISFSRRDKSNHSPSLLLQLINRSKDTVERLYPELSKNIQWKVSCGPHTVLHCNPEKIVRLLINLFRNSLQALDFRKGEISIIVRRTRNWIYTIIEDNAGGIPQDIITKIFDPFFSKNNNYSGTGLGLSICHSIVQDHYGKIKVKSSGKNTRFTVCFPVFLSNREKK